MEIVIKIPDSVYQKVKDGEADELTSAYVVGAVSDGIPLPKGHGRLIDGDKLEHDIEHSYQWFETDNDYDYACGKIADAPTIIEEVKADES